MFYSSSANEIVAKVYRPMFLNTCALFDHSYTARCSVKLSCGATLYLIFASSFAIMIAIWRLPMPTLIVRNIEPELHTRLKASAASHHQSMEEEVRQVLRTAFPPAAPSLSLWDAVRALVEPLGGVELELSPRTKEGAGPDFSGPEWDRL
jgi:plasmid stability protein